MAAGRRFGRRRFLGAAAGLAGAASLAGKARAQAPQRLVIASAWPADALGIADGLAVFLDRLAALLAGPIEISFQPAGQPLPPQELLKSLEEGRIDLAYTTPHYGLAGAPALQFFAGVPFGMTVQEFRAWLAFGGGQLLWERAYEPRGLLPFYAGSSGTQSGGWFREPLEGASGLEGRRVRISGLGADLFRRLGAEPLLVPPGEILEALRNGKLDGVDWIGPWNDLAFGLQQEARYCYMPGFHEPAPIIEVLANRRRLEALPLQVHACIAAAAEQAAARTLAAFHHHDAANYRRMLRDFGSEVRAFPQELAERASRESRLMLEEIAARDLLAEETYHSYVDFLSTAAAYAPRAEQGYLNLRTLAFGSGR